MPRRFPKLSFELKIIKTTGDKLQTASLAQEGKTLPKGFSPRNSRSPCSKHRADLAVHSLKDLPTELPAGLCLGAVGKRADVRDVLIYRDADYLRAAERTRAPPSGRPAKPPGAASPRLACRICPPGRWWPPAAPGARRSCWRINPA